MPVIFVGIGGGLGAICRYLISLLPFKSEFPILTLITNLLGAVIIGIIVGITEREKDLPESFTLLLKTGFCGGFTTFSTFSLETYTLFDHGKYFLGGLYAVSSLILCLLGVWCGKMLVKK